MAIHRSRRTKAHRRGVGSGRFVLGRRFARYERQVGPRISRPAQTADPIGQGLEHGPGSVPGRENLDQGPVFGQAAADRILGVNPGQVVGQISAPAADLLGVHRGGGHCPQQRRGDRQEPKNHTPHFGVAPNPPSCG